MKQEITVGGLSEGAFWAEKMTLPVLDEVSAMVWISDALDQALTERKGVAVIGSKGTGKSVALRRVIDDFHEIEGEAEAADANRPRRGLTLLNGPRAEKRRDVLEVIWKAVVGMPPIQSRGRKVGDDMLLEMLVEEILRQNVAALVVDEAENLSEEALYVLRDIVSLAETTSQERYAGDEYSTAGVGVLLVGVGDLAPRLRATGEAGHRWLRIQRVTGLEPARAAKVYLQFLPGLQPHVDEIGSGTWEEYVRVNVCMGASIPIRLIENHVRNYARRMVTADDSIGSRAQIPFNAETFEFTLKELQAARLNESG